MTSTEPLALGTGPTAEVPHTRVAVVGTGFAGLGMARELLRRGIDFVVFERAADVGGTWRDNHYPGLRCDVPSHLYSFTSAPNPDWSHTYSPGPEIWAYMQRCAREFGTLPHTRFGHEVTRTAWDDEHQRWTVETTQGTWTADVVVLGNGPLSEPSVPAIPGLDTFAGTMFHSAHWDHDHDLRGERVAVIGTGASAIQFVPHVQERAEHLVLFQRTPAWVMPHTDRPIPAWKRALYRRVPLVQRLVREGVFWSRELLVVPFVKRPALMRRVKGVALHHLAKQVPDADLRAKLTPDYSPGCKRLLLSNEYYPAVAAANTELVTDGVAEVRPRSVVSRDGVEHPVDTIIFGTGFHVTDNPVAHRVQGTGGETLAQAWAASGMRAYKGTAIPDFPNLFMLAGPNTGIGHTSLVYMIESQITYVLDALDVLERRRAGAVEVRRDVFDHWNEQLHRRMRGTVWMQGGCASWYLDDKGRNPTIWPDWTWRFRRDTRRFDTDAYRFAPRHPSAAPPSSGA